MARRIGVDVEVTGAEGERPPVRGLHVVYRQIDLQLPLRGRVGQVVGALERDGRTAVGRVDGR